MSIWLHFICLCQYTVFILFLGCVLGHLGSTKIAGPKKEDLCPLPPAPTDHTPGVCNWGGVPLMPGG